MFSRVPDIVVRRQTPLRCQTPTQLLMPLITSSLKFQINTLTFGTEDLTQLNIHRKAFFNFSAMKSNFSKSNRREFLKTTGLTGLGLMAPGTWNAFSGNLSDYNEVQQSMIIDEKNVSLIGPYGQWAASLTEGKLPSHSFRRKEFTDLETWRKQARARFSKSVLPACFSAMM